MSSTNGGGGKGGPYRLNAEKVCKSGQYVKEKSGRVHNLGGFDKRGRLHIAVPKKGKDERGGGREIRILEKDNIVVCAGQYPKKYM